MTTITREFAVEGMHCQGCVSSVTGAVKRVAGVANVSVSLEQKSATVEFDPANPTQFAYWRPDDGIVWASYMHKGYVYTADHVRGVDVLKLTASASAARSAGREVAAPAISDRQAAFLARPRSQRAAAAPA